MKNDFIAENNFSKAVEILESTAKQLEKDRELVAALFWEQFKNRNPEKAEIIEELLGYAPEKVSLEKAYDDDYGTWAAKLYFESAGEQNIYVVSHSEHWNGDEEKASGLFKSEADALRAVYYEYPECAREIITE
ncbi:MAG: hypothetical protein ACYCSQ_00220 [bacterium]